MSERMGIAMALAVAASGACAADGMRDGEPDDAGDEGCELGTQGPTVCPRDEGLFDPGQGPWTPLAVRSASAIQSHCGEIVIAFGLSDESCSFGDVASLYFFLNGPGTYEVGDKRLTCLRDETGTSGSPPPDQPPLAAVAWRGGVEEGPAVGPFGGDSSAELYGFGVIEVESAEYDGEQASGSVDVVFPDGTRLLDDFRAPLCITE